MNCSSPEALPFIRGNKAEALYMEVMVLNHIFDL